MRQALPAGFDIPVDLRDIPDPLVILRWTALPTEIAAAKTKMQEQIYELNIAINTNYIIYMNRLKALEKYESYNRIITAVHRFVPVSNRLDGSARFAVNAAPPRSAPACG